MLEEEGEAQIGRLERLMGVVARHSTRFPSTFLFLSLRRVGEANVKNPYGHGLAMGSFAS